MEKIANNLTSNTSYKKRIRIFYSRDQRFLKIQQYIATHCNFPKLSYVLFISKNRKRHKKEKKKHAYLVKNKSSSKIPFAQKVASRSINRNVSSTRIRTSHPSTLLSFSLPLFHLHGVKWILIEWRNEWSNEIRTPWCKSLYPRLDGILSVIYYLAAVAWQYRKINTRHELCSPRFGQPRLSPGKEIGLGHCCTPQDSYNPPHARTTQCIQRRENYFMRNSRWNCIYGEPVAGFVVDSCCNCLIYMKIGNSREPTHVISLLRCTIILLKGNSMRIFDLRWFICAALSIRNKIFFPF